MNAKVKFFKSRFLFRIKKNRLLKEAKIRKKNNITSSIYIYLGEETIYNLERLFRRIDTDMVIDYEQKSKKEDFDKSAFYKALGYIKLINQDYFYLLLASINTGFPKYYFLYGDDKLSVFIGTKNISLTIVEYNNSSKQISNLVHELGHQIDYINNGNENPECSYLTEMLPILMELLVADDLYFNQGKVEAISIYKERHDNILCMIRNLKFFLEYQNLPYSKKSDKQVIKLLYYKYFKVDKNYKYITEYIYKASKSRYIDYILSYVCAIELRKIFYQDRELCFKKLDEIMEKRFNITSLGDLGDLGIDIFKEEKIDIFGTDIQKHYINQ